MASLDRIRNFCIIAHIDHGKSTLADRLLEVTQTVSKREMRAQLLDQMDLERERGITIKLQPARMQWHDHELNLIDTPGHADFTYEVSRSLAAVEGAILLVDATQGVQAQTVANVYLALEQNLTIIPVINKIDLPNAQRDHVRAELVDLLGVPPTDILEVSAKTGVGVPEILQAIIDRIPAPRGSQDAPARALIFDALYDSYRGIVTYIRMVDGVLKTNEKIQLMGTGHTATALEVGSLSPRYQPGPAIETGQIGYVVTSLRTIDQARVGDTLTSTTNPAQQALAGYREVKPMVYAGIFSRDADVEGLREALNELKLSDAALQFEPERSPALGVGFRCGFLGLLHLEIVTERLKREHNVDVIITVPSVAYQVKKTNGEKLIVRNPSELPDQTEVGEIAEPWVQLDIITPADSLGSVMQLASERGATYVTTEYLAHDRAYIHYQAPLSVLLTDFYDSLKSATSGYGSLNYALIEYRPADVVKLSVLIADEPVESLSRLVYRDRAYAVGRSIVDTLATKIPPSQFEIKIQAALGGKIVAASRVKAYRKDVTAGLYGGDVTRKRKLLEKQKKGKARMKSAGRGSVDIPQSAYVAVMRHH